MDYEKVINHITAWLKDYAVNARSKGFIIGISGGIDSAVTSFLCAKTGLEVICVEMNIHQTLGYVRKFNHFCNGGAGDAMEGDYINGGVNYFFPVPRFDGFTA